jgi:uncharacterized membrane protein YhhN
VDAALAAAAAVAALGYLASPALGGAPLWLAAKPVPAACLAVFAWRCGTSRRAAARQPDSYPRRIAAGLALSALADLAIEKSFLAGLATFLIAHVAYGFAFWSETRTLRPLRALPALALGSGILFLLAGRLGEMAWPVAVYAAAIGTMLWRATERLGTTPRGVASGRLGMAGAFSFALSDTLIALDRFLAALPYGRYPIMLLYWAGQLGIALSARPVQVGRPSLSEG